MIFFGPRMDFYSYTTIDQPVEGLFREKGSRFLAFAYPANSEEEIKQRIEHLKKEYFDARHHCFAWMLGPARTQFRAFDDGEPNHSAGDPILGQIRSRNLTNILVVVVRYFGGVKLGVGGLVAAYKAAAEDALSKARVIEVEIKFSMTITFPYEATSEVMRVVNEFDLRIVSQEFSESCIIRLEIPIRKKRTVIERFELLKAKGKVSSFEFPSPDEAASA
jgi:uncharacterized YigZ family protein